MEFKTLSNSSITEIVEVFNAAFSSYSVPISLTETSLTRKIMEEKIELDLSVGVFLDKKLIAFVLHGIHLKYAYNAGTGVMSEWRGKNLTLSMYSFILPLLKKEGISKIKLEVISSNIGAIKSYRKIGFFTTRKLNCYKHNGKVKWDNNRLFEIKQLNEVNWDEFYKFWSWMPTWQNSLFFLPKYSSDLLIYAAYLKSKLVGYLIYCRFSNKIKQFAVHPKHRNTGCAGQLFNVLYSSIKTPPLLINVDANCSETNQFLKSLGFYIFVEQYEMELDLK